MMACKTPGKTVQWRLGAGELGHSLGSLRDGVLGEFTRQDQSDGSLHLPRGQSPLLAVAAQTTSLTSDTVEGILHQVVHDSHGSLADTSLRVHLLQNLHDVRRERLRPLALDLLTSLLGARFLHNLLACHFVTRKPLIDKQSDSHLF